MPFENSTNGSVIYTLDLFADRRNAYPDICVSGEAYLAIHHCLLGYTSATQSATPLPNGHQGGLSTGSLNLHDDAGAKPIQSLQHVKRIYTHPQAFGQCDVFLSNYLKGVERHEVSSTSKAAEIVSKDSTKMSAAISSHVAAKVHHLSVLAQNIEDRDDNTTRFLLLSSKARHPDVLTEGSSGHGSKTLVSFTIDQRVPGALADALTVFKSYGLNLTSINSRPTKEARWDYVFFVEFQGSRLADPQGRVTAALKDLATVAKGWRWLGSWSDELRRRPT